MASKFEDGPTIEGPIEAFLKPGMKPYLQRGLERSEGTVTISHVDVENKTLWFSNPLPQGIKRGDFIVIED
jgi:hypothetical protein